MNWLEIIIIGFLMLLTGISCTFAYLRTIAIITIERKLTHKPYLLLIIPFIAGSIVIGFGILCVFIVTTQVLNGITICIMKNFNDTFTTIVLFVFCVVESFILICNIIIKDN